MSKSTICIIRRTLFLSSNNFKHPAPIISAFQILRSSGNLALHNQEKSLNYLTSPCVLNVRGIHKSPEYDAAKDDAGKELAEPEQKLGLFKKFKQMYRDYWYVLVPVHLVTSAAWFGGFYYCAKSGVDLVSLAQTMNLSETIIEKLKTGGKSTAANLAISYALYKIATPLRYTVTIGGTTVSINYLTKYGYIKPIPKKAELQKMMQDRKDNFMEKTDAMKLNIIEKRNAIKILKTNIDK